MKKCILHLSIYWLELEDACSFSGRKGSINIVKGTTDPVRRNGDFCSWKLTGGSAVFHDSPIAMGVGGSTWRLYSSLLWRKTPHFQWINGKFSQIYEKLRSDQMDPKYALGGPKLIAWTWRSLLKSWSYTSNPCIYFSILLDWRADHTSYLSREPWEFSCKFFLSGVNFYRFNAKNWQFTVYFAVITQKIGNLLCILS